MSSFDNPRIEEVLTTVLQIAPAFTQQWNEHLAYWGNDRRGQFIDVAEIATFLVRSFKEGHSDWFPELFTRIEEWLKRGDADLDQLLSVGLLEDIQIAASHESFGQGVFEQWLGPVTKAQWTEISQMWQGKSSLMDVIRAEKQAEKRRGGGGCA